MIEKFLCALFVMGVAAIAPQDEGVYWTPLASSVDGRSVAIDYHSVKRNGQRGTAWFQWDFSKTKSERARSAKVLEAYDCEAETQGLLSRVDYDARGVVLRSTSINYVDYSPVVPGSIGEAMMHAVCRQPQS